MTEHKARFWQRFASLTFGLVVTAGFGGCGRESVDPDQRQTSSPAGGEPSELTLTPPIAAGEGDLFEDVTGRAGIDFRHQFCDTRIANIIQSNGSGVAVLDYDRDGFVDLYLVNAGPLEGVTHHPRGTVREPNRLYRNRGDGTFEDVTVKAGVTGHSYGIAAVAGDYDGDGWVDLYVVNVGANILYRNKGDGTFADVASKAGVADRGTGIGAVFLDADRDGHLDLFVANYLTFDPDYKLYFNPDGYPGPLAYQPEFNLLYRNNGDGTFRDVSEQSGVRIAGHRAMSVCAFDADGDGDTDLYICNDMTPNLLLVNDGTGRFEENALKRGVAFNALGEAAGSMTAAVGDCNGDLIPDIMVSRLGYGSLYMGGKTGLFEDRMIASGLGGLTAQYVGWGNIFIDYDNDGHLDIFVANGDAHHLVGWESLLLRNQGNGTFVDDRDAGGHYFNAKIRARGTAMLDFDNDGGMDLLVTAMGDRPFLLRNRGQYNRHWLMLDLEGTRSNREGFGAIIHLDAGGRRAYAEARCPSGFLGSSDRRVHFGLGPSRVADRIEIKWPSGTVQVLEQVAADQVLKIKEPSNAS
ncbi:MAG: VCBS repeat-containing protein [Verrucomicrobia bacterium]|nr:VCBS repeat-containing protein [Verrucomicrobiota bacterium]